MAEKEFWRMNGRQFAARLEAFSEREMLLRQEADYRAGTIAAAVWNTAPFLDDSARGRNPEDFFGSLEELGRRRMASEREQQDPERMLAAFRELMGGRIKRAES